MSKPKSPPRGRWLVSFSVLASALLAACANQAPPAPKTAAAHAGAAGAALAPAAPALRLLSPAEARSFELAAVSVSSLDHLLTNGATLITKAVPLPIDPAGVRDMLLAQAGLSPEVAANLDLGAPSGAAVVSTGAPGATGAVMAVAARGPAEAARVVTALGKVLDRRGDAVLIDNGTGGRGWIYRDGSVIVFSDDVEALARGARLAEEARHAVAEDVTAVLFPDAIARANGTDVKTALAMLMAQLQAAQSQAPGGGVQMQTFEELVALVGDAEAAELGLAVDAVKGVSVRMRLRARAGSKLQAIARDVHPYELDGTLLATGKAPPALVAASSVGGFLRAQMARQREQLQASKAKGAPAALAFHEALTAAVGGQTAFAASFVKQAPLFAGQLAYPLKDAAAATSLGVALGKLDRDAAVLLLEAEVGKMPMLEWTVKKEGVGKLKTLHYRLAFKKDSGVDPELVKKVFGKTLDVYVTVAGTRFLTTFGHDAKATLVKVAAATPATPMGALAETMAVTKGRDAFFHFDLGSVLSVVASVVKDKKAARIAKAETGPIPIYGSAGGDGVGKVWSLDFTVPPTAFVNAGALVKEGMATNADSEGGKELAAPPKGAGKAGKPKGATAK